MELAGKNTLIVGLGMTGVAVAQFLKKKGATVTITDLAGEEELVPHLHSVGEMDIRLELGQHKIETFEGADLIVLSPGVPDSILPLTRAKEKGITVLGEIELASRFIQEPIVAITGTNGKTTTTSLLGDMLTHSGKKVFIGGNIGNPLICYVDKKEKAQIVVVEVSSFQLDTINTFRPKVGVLLNITEDHLDRYPDFNAYAKSKARLFKNQQQGDTAVLNGADELIRKMSKKIKSRKLFFNTGSETLKGAGIHNSQIILYLEENLLETDKKIKSIDLAGLGLSGRHNMENAAAASLAALVSGGTIEGVQSALNCFKGPGHRLEYVDTISGVKYFNDSKATNTDAVVRALEAFDTPVILIMGGRNKGGSFHVLKDLVHRHVKKLIVLGEAKAEIMSALGHECRGGSQTAGTMEDAVSQAYRAAAAGNIVLLSPACSSFDMYGNYAQRGEDFRAVVKNLKEQTNGR